MSLQFKQLTLEDLPAVQTLQQQVCAALDDPNILQPLSREELLNILNGNGVMIGVFDAKRCIAFRALLKPEVGEDEHLGLDVGAVDLSRVLYQEISNVHPDYRGQNLQKRMATFILEQIDLSAYDWMCSTVMPYNIASLKDKFSQGMYVYALKLKYGGKLRYVFGKQLHVTPAEKIVSELVAMDDTEKQQQLLKAGYVGTKMEYIDENWFVTYQK